MCKLGMISQEQSKIEGKLLLSANRKSHMLRRLAQQRMTFSDLVIETQRSIAGFILYQKAEFKFIGRICSPLINIHELHK